MSDYKPSGYNSVSPYLIASNAPEIIEFMVKVFDGKQLRRFNRPDGSLMHAEVRIDDSVVMIGGSQTPEQAIAPHVHVYVKDAQKVYDRALAAGAKSVQVPERKDANDDFRAGFTDSAGTTWWVANQ